MSESDATRKLNTAIVLLLGAGLVLYVLIRIMFPSFDYHLVNFNNSKIQMVKETIASKHYLAVTPLYDYPYHEVVMEAKTTGGARMPQKVDVFKDFTVQMYPISGKQIDSKQELDQYLFFGNDTGLPNGSLIADDETVYFISRGQARPFLDAEVFVRLEYDWNEVLGGSQVLNQLEQGEKIDFISAHPDGTFLKTSTGEIFLVWEKQRLPVADESLVQQAWDGFHHVQVHSTQAELFDSCFVDKQNSKNAQCSFAPDRTGGENIGHTYLFELPEQYHATIVDARSEFDMLGRFDLSVARASLNRVKDNLHMRYEAYLF